MANCLVTKLMEVVNNDNLPILGFAKIYFKSITSASFQSNSIRGLGFGTNPSTLKTIGGVYFANSSFVSLDVQEKSYTPSDQVTVTNGNGTLLIPDDSKTILPIAGAASTPKGWYIKLEELGDIDSLDLTKLNVAYTDSAGDINSIAGKVNLTELNLSYASLITGNIAKFAEEQIDKHQRTSGTLAINSNGIIKMYGNMGTTNQVQYTINYISSTQFTIATSAIIRTFDKVNGVWTFSGETPVGG